MRRDSVRIGAQVAFFFLILWCPSPLGAQSAPGGPGTLPTWTSGGKEAVGTSANVESRVWFTLQGGVLTEVYYPRLDVADVRTLEFAVSDGHSMWLESRDLDHSIESLDERALLFRQSSRERQGRFTLTKTYVTDPQRDVLLIEVNFQAHTPGLALYVLFDPALGNTGSGDSGSSVAGALVTTKPDLACALVGSPGFSRMSSGFANVNDGLTDLLLHRKLNWEFARAENGNVMQVAELPAQNRLTLALGFGKSAGEAVEHARASLARGFAAVQSEYVNGWHQAVSSLVQVNEKYRKQFYEAAMVLKAHEDKIFRGAMIASMSVPWGFASKADQGNAGGYHLVWARDLYEVATALMALGDRAAAGRALDYLLHVQQRPDGSFPQNTWLDGRAYGTAIQMDETSYPLILAWQLGRTDSETWKKHVRPAAEYVLKHGPRTEQERWEETDGYSPSTIAAEIAGLVCAAEIAQANGAADDAEQYLRTADDWVAHLEDWMVTTTGHLGGELGRHGYYIRLNNNTDPNDGFQLAIGNGAGPWDERDVVDAGFLELVRLGIKRADDPAIVRSLAVVDSLLRVETPNGPGWYRYNHDGYGEKFYGAPYDGTGIGRLWPLLTGERGEYEVARGQDAGLYLDAMMKFANAGGMIPEQVWDRAEPTPSKYVFGQGTNSATPLAWSMAEFIRLVICDEQKRVVEQPEVVADRYLTGR
jgi:glucoamylase